MNVGRKHLVGWMELIPNYSRSKLYVVNILISWYQKNKNTSCPKMVSVFAVHDKYLPVLDATSPTWDLGEE